MPCGDQVAMMLSPTESGSILTLGTWIVDHSPVLCDDTVEQVEVEVSKIS
jgi:hypothetical protein